MKRKPFTKMSENSDQAVEYDKSIDLQTIYCDNTDFVLKDNDWREFNERLEAPPRNLTALQKLLKDKFPWQAIVCLK